MNRKIWTRQELISMDRNQFETICICLRAKAYRLLGFNWKKWISFTENQLTGDIEITWE